MVYLNVGHTGLNQPGHAHWVRKAAVKAIYCVYDLIPITHPQYVREGERERHTARMLTVLDHAKGVIAISQDSVDNLTDFAKLQRRRVPPILRAPLGVSIPDPQIDVVVPPPEEPYFVILGTIEGRKNHLLLLAVWRKLIATCSDNAPKLVIIGRRGWSAQDVFAALDDDQTLKPHIIELNDCSDANLQIYLSRARALLFPSFVEGQGLPLLEALVAGVPVIASDLEVFRETGGDVPEYLDPNDCDAWAQAVVDYSATSSAHRAAQIERLRGFSPITWADHFALVDEWLKVQQSS